MLASTLLALLPLLAAPVAAAPTPIPVHHLQKRWNECWGYNNAGCPYSDVGSHGAVATEVGTCSAYGVQILQQGGSAADSIIASALCVGVISAYHSGIGGGGFMVIRFKNADGSHGYEQIDFRETMPAAGNETMYSQYGANETQSTIGGLAVGVPGEMRAWELLHKRHGKLPWKALFKPAIDVARGGFPVNYDLAGFLTGYPMMLTDPLWSEVYAPNGTLAQEGDIIYKHRLANTLERISKEGAGVFYDKHSSIAKNTIKAIKNATPPGIMTLDDLAGYKAILRNASSITYRGKKLFSTTAPSSGAIVLSSLKIFEGFDGSASDTDPTINLTLHRLIEADQLAYGQRTTLGDPAFTANVSTLEASYLTDAVAAAARAKIVDNSTFPVTYYDPTTYIPSPPEGGTSHLAVVGPDGDAVSLTTTVNLIWGSRVMTEDGFVLNDEMDDFSSPGQTNAFGFAANPINFIQPGKRPQSSIASSLVEDENGDLIFATGSAGGSRIITATLQELYHFLDQDLNATQCTRHPRWHDQLSGKTYFDYDEPWRPIPLAGFDNGTVEYFRAMGYNVTYQEPYSTSTSHAIGRLAGGDWLAASDPRKPAGHGQAF